MTTAAPPTAAEIVRARSCGRAGCPCARAVKAGYGLTHCLAHEDANPSLSVTQGRERVLVKCHRGCDQGAVVAALQAAGLWAEQAQRPAPVTREFGYSLNGHGMVYHVRMDVSGRDKRLWWVQADHQTRGLPEGVRIEQLPLYRVEQLAERPDDIVLLLEGEGKTDLAIEHGYLAVCLGGGAAQRSVGTALQPLRGRDVILLPDNDLPGRDYMKHLAGMLAGLARSVRIVELPGLPPKGDLVDWYAAGGTDEQLEALLTASSVAAAPAPAGESRFISAPELLRTEFPPLRQIVAGMLLEGGVILAGKPKLGKTWLALGLALAVAAGGRALGQLAVETGDVLYLALEDGKRRAKDRIAGMLAGEPAPERLTLAFSWPRLDEGGLTEIADWITAHRDARLVVVDTLKRVRPREKGNQRLYDLDYDALAPLADLAKSAGVCVLVVHHTRKADADDVFDTISGSAAVTASVDGAMVLRGVRGSGEAELAMAHRDLNSPEWGLRFEETPLGWVITGSAEEARRSGEQKAILRVIAAAEGDPISSREIGQELGKAAATVRRLIAGLRRDGMVDGSEHGYRLSDKAITQITEKRAITPITPITPHSFTPESGGTVTPERRSPPDHPRSPPDRGDRPDRHDQGDRGDRFIRDVRDPHRVPDAEDDPARDYAVPVLCPAGCGVALRDDWCPLCGVTFREASP